MLDFSVSVELSSAETYQIVLVMIIFLTPSSLMHKNSSYFHLLEFVCNQSFKILSIPHLYEMVSF